MLKNNTSKKLTGYSALAAAFMMGGMEAEAAVVYTDLAPGVTVDGSSFDIDFDGDGVIDATVFQSNLYSYTTSYGSTYGTAVVALDAGANNMVGYGYASGFVYASALASGVLVGATGSAVPNIANSLAGFGFATLNYSSAFGAWTTPGTDAYIGMEFTAGSGAIHNAWIRVLVNDANSAVILGYAYDDVAGTPILTGDEGSACDSSTPPANFTATVGASTVTFDWDAVPGSVGCQLAAGPAGSGSFPVTRNFLGASVTSSGAIPLSIIPPGNYEAKVRCACSITPIDATGFSNTDQFTVAPPRMGAELEANLSPNPATNQLVLTYDAIGEEEVTFRLLNIAGQELFAQTATMFTGKQNVAFDVSDFEEGMYFLSIENGDKTITEQFEVIK